MGDASRGLVAGVVSTILYALLIAAIALSQQCPPPSIAAVADKAPEDPYAQLKAIREKVELPKPPPPPPPPPAVEEPLKQEAPKKKPKRKRNKKKAPKQPASEAPDVAPAEPAPLVLENVNLTGGVNVQQGEKDIFGDPSVAATDTNTKPQPVVEEDPVIIGAKPTRASRALRGLYPDDAPRTGRVVSVVLKIAVNAEGKPTSVKVLRSAGAAFDKEARRIGRRLRFRPATRDGEPISWTVRWTVDFDPNL